jgi:hypothetical protein
MHRIQVTFRFDRNQSAACRTKTQWFSALQCMLVWRNMAPNSNRGSNVLLLKGVLSRARQRRRQIESVLHFLKIRRQKLLKASFLIALLILSGRNAAVPIQRSCRRLG